MPTTFQNKVYTLTKKIPKGRVTTYKLIAIKIKSKAFRAVGSALHKNPYKEVPCHRVVNSSGDLGGFARGISKKRSILKKEGLIIKNNKIINFRNILYKF